MAVDFDKPPIIIKRVKKGKHAHHGGAWKIAYADFVTAMMAFFLLLWLISMTTDEQKKGLADYFAPPNVSQTTSGAGGVLGGTAMDSAGGKMAPLIPDASQSVFTSTDTTQFGSPEAIAGGKEIDVAREFDATVASKTDINSAFDQEFHSAAASIKQAWQAMPEVAQVSENLIVEETKEGLNILIVDQEGRPMFPEGSKYPNEITRKAIAAIAPILARLSNQIEISGHTAAGGTYNNPRYGAWDLSTDRANVVRGILGEFGLPEGHVSAVTGYAASRPFFSGDPYLSANERVEITVVEQPPPVPPGMSP